jgi:hypothetical protein
MSRPILPLTIEMISENSEEDLEFEITYDCWQNERYDTDFILSCAVTILIFSYVQFIDYIAKKYLH